MLAVWSLSLCCLRVSVESGSGPQAIEAVPRKLLRQDCFARRFPQSEGTVGKRSRPVPGLETCPPAGLSFAKGPMKLPINCDVHYYPGFLSPEESAVLYQAIWNACDLSPAKIVTPDGSESTLSLGKCMFVDDELVDPTRFHPAHGPRRPWIDELLALKQRIEDLTGRVYQVCVCIYYKDGECGADYHSDLTAFGDVSSIASVSLGAERAFMLRRVDNHEDTYRIDLGEGSLVIIGDRCQELYELELPVDPDCREPRINLTFRIFGWK